MSHEENIAGRLYTPQHETMSHSTEIGNPEVVGLSYLEKRRYGLLFRNVVTHTPKSILYSLLPENNRAQRRYVPAAAQAPRSRADIVNAFRQMSDKPEEFSHATFVQEMQGFADAGYVTEEYRIEQVMGGVFKDVVYIEETLDGADYARPAAYLAQLFELRFGMPVAAVMSEAMVSKDARADEVDAHPSMLLLHLHAAKHGLDSLQLGSLTNTEATTIVPRMRQWSELGVIDRLKSAYWKNAEQPFHALERNRTVPSLAASVRDALIHWPDNEIITPDRVLQVFAEYQGAVDLANLPDEEAVMKQLSAFGKAGHLIKAASQNRALYQLTSFGQEITEALLVPLVKIARGKHDVMIPDGGGGSISLMNQAILRLRAAHPAIAAQLLGQYRLHAQTPEARERRKAEAAQNALRVFDDVEGAVAGGALRRAARILPFDWKRVVDYLLQNEYIEVSGKVYHGNEYLYAITAKGRRALDGGHMPANNNETVT